MWETREGWLTYLAEGVVQPLGFGGGMSGCVRYRFDPCRAGLFDRVQIRVVIARAVAAFRRGSVGQNGLCYFTSCCLIPASGILVVDGHANIAPVDKVHDQR